MGNKNGGVKTNKTAQYQSPNMLTLSDECSQEVMFLLASFHFQIVWVLGEKLNVYVWGGREMFRAEMEANTENAAGAEKHNRKGTVWYCEGPWSHHRCQYMGACQGTATLALILLSIFLL